MTLSSVQISIEFKEIMKEEKNKGESFEDYIKKLRNKSIDSENNSIENKSKSIESKQIYRKVIVKPETEFITLPDDVSGIPTKINKKLLPWPNTSKGRKANNE